MVHNNDMQKSKTMFLYIGVVIFLITPPLETTAISPQLLNDSFETFSINTKYLDIVNWYFALTSDIAVTIISNETLKDISFNDMTSKLLYQFYSSIFNVLLL